MSTQLASFFIGALSGVMFIVCYFFKFEIKPGTVGAIEMTYAEWATISLAAASLVMTGVALLIGVLAFWGKAQMQRDISNIARDEAAKVSREVSEVHAQKAVESSIEDGKIKELIAEATVEQFAGPTEKQEEIGWPEQDDEDESND